MNRNSAKIFGTLLLAGLISPGGFLFSQPSENIASATNGTVAAGADAASTHATQNAFGKIEDSAQNVRQEVGPLKFGTTGTNLAWKVQVVRLRRIKKNVDQMEAEVNQLAVQKSNLPKWQQDLLGNVKEDALQMVYQTSAALKTLNKHHQNLAATAYFQNIKTISQKANSAANSIGTVFQHHGVDMD